jgi:stage IV sporulation protein FB
MEQLDLKIKVKPSFLLAAILVFIIGKLHILLFYLIGVFIHELSHYYVARRYYYTCELIQLSAFGLTLYGDFEEAVKKEQIHIAIAGPAANLIIAVIIFASWYIYPELYVYTDEFLYANLSIGLVNLLPCYPLDGGKILIGLMNQKYPYKYSLKVVKAISIIASLALFAMFALSLFITEQPLFSFGLFAILLFSSQMETADKKIYSRINNIFARKKRAKYGLEKKCLVFPSTVTLRTVLNRLEMGSIYEIEVVDENYDVIARFDEKTFGKLLTTHSHDTIISDLL